ncbi:MAG: HepT-like ribonuclease domain-containing protein [Planctomycetota bacterium]
MGHRRCPRLCRGTLRKRVSCGHKRTRWAVFSQIIVIGEAAGRLPREYQQRHPSIPWSDIIGMRNRLIHGYDQVQWDRVWETVTVHLPKLKATIEPLIPKEP